MSRSHTGDANKTIHKAFGKDVKVIPAGGAGEPLLQSCCQLLFQSRDNNNAPFFRVLELSAHIELLAFRLAIALIDQKKTS